jgi:hypothetical protein
MTRYENKPEQKSPAKPGISGAPDSAPNEISDLELDKVAGGMRKAGGDPHSAGKPFLKFDFKT